MSGRTSRSLLRSEEYLCGSGFGRRETSKGDEVKWKGTQLSHEGGGGSLSSLLPLIFSSSWQASSPA